MVKIFMRKKSVMEKLADWRILLIFCVLLLSSYLWATNYIQTKELYPWNQDWFDYSFYQKYAPQDCFFVHPSYINLWSEKNLLTHSLLFEKRCDFTEAFISISVTSMRKVEIKNNRNLTANFLWNLSEPNRLIITVNSSGMVKGKSYDFQLYFLLNESFYNFYTFSSEGYKIANVQIVMDNSIFGYNCGGESCFTVLEGKLEREEPLWRGISKEYRFDETDRVKIRFSPVSNKWFLVQKLLDALILGVIAGLIVYFFTEQKNKNYLWGNEVKNIDNDKMSKENIKKIIKMMEEIEDSDGKSITEKILIDKFGAKQFNQFKTYCDGNDRKYVIERTGFLSLTQSGSHEFNRLRQESRQIDILEQQTLFSKILTFFTAFLAVGVVFGHTVGKNYSLTASLVATSAIVGSAILLYVVGKGLVKYL